ncbi:piggyBac transposable element-derived protein 3-like protein, partial [Dinothrombium tinctorium]
MDEGSEIDLDCSDAGLSSDDDNILTDLSDEEPIHSKKLKLPSTYIDESTDELSSEEEGCSAWKPELYLDKYLPQSIFELMAKHTNGYYEKNNPGKCLNTNAEEIQNFLGLQIYMSTMGLRRIAYYWKPEFQCAFITSVMPYNRFSTLRNNLHIVDVDSEKDQEDKLWKISPIISHIRSVCNDLMKDNRLAIDEQMIGFKSNRMPSKQYMPMKPTKYGLKNYVLAGPTGLVFDFLVYQGNTTPINSDEIEKFGHAGAVVLKLLSGVERDKSTVVYMDRYFTSIELFLELCKRKIYASGPIKENRIGRVDFGESKKDFKKEPRGTFRELVSEKGNLCLIRWLDSNPLTFLSSFVGTMPVMQAKRYSRKKGESVFIDLPYAIHDYNKNMGGVDLCDQLLAYYQPPRTRKWTIRAIFHFIDLAICNSWNEYRESQSDNTQSDNLDLFSFRLNIARQFCSVKPNRTRGRPRKKPQKKRKQPLQRFDGKNHLPSFDESRNFASRCALRSCSARSKIYCVKCKVHLCVRQKKDCFRKYHMEDNTTAETSTDNSESESETDSEC